MPADIGFGSGRSAAAEAKVRTVRDNAKRMAAKAADAMEDCNEELRDWRERARTFPRWPAREPESGRCDVRRLKRSLRTMADDGGDEEWLHST